MRCSATYSSASVLRFRRRRIPAFKKACPFLSIESASAFLAVGRSCSLPGLRNVSSRTHLLGTIRHQPGQIAKQAGQRSGAAAYVVCEQDPRRRQLSFQLLLLGSSAVRQTLLSPNAVVPATDGLLHPVAM